MPTDTPHITAEQADLYVAAGLPADERSAVEAHILDCPPCAAMIANATTADASLRSILSAVRPSAALEAGVVFQLRQAQRMRLTPPVRRAAVVAAAAAGVIMTGWIGSTRLATSENAERAMTLNSDVFMVPDSKAEKWDFGGGSNTAVNWTNWPGGKLGTKNDFRFASLAESPNDNAFGLDWSTRGGSKALNAGDALDRVRHDVVGHNSVSPAAGDGSDAILSPSLGAESDRKLSSASGATPPLNGALAFRPEAAADAAGKVSAYFFADSELSKDKSAAKTSEQLFSLGRRAMVNGDVGVAASPSAAAADGDGRSRGDVTKTPSDDLGRDKAPTAHGMQGQDGAAAGGAKPGYTMGGRVDRTGVYSSTGKQIAIKQPGLLAGLEVQVPPGDAGQTGDGARPNPSPTTHAFVDTRKVIRTGTMTFEVEHFDTAADTLAKVVAEAGGFIGTVDSQKLPNGKTQGTVTVRCPPERLDLLVLSLRSLGDLKSQQIVAQDVTKEYTDLEGELTADRAMADRMLDLIRTGKGAIKDLLAAEKELGTWRQKIEHIEGELRYLNSQVGMSTLSVVLAERDIRQAASTIETETADMGVEADDVEKARDGAIKAIDDAKGRVIEAELKRLDAGQLAARIVADVPPEMAGATIDRLKQLGRVARLDVQRQQTAVDSGTTSPTAPLRTERRPTRVALSIYNLANVAPRRTTAVTLAANDPESAYAALLALANPGGRVVVSNLNRTSSPTGTVSLEIPPARVDAALATVRSLGEVLKRTATESPDTQNTTDAKVGLSVSVVAMASVTPREIVQQTVAAADVRNAYQAVLLAAGTGHVRSAELNEQDRQNVSGLIEVDLPRAALAAFQRAIGAAGDTVSQSAARSADTDDVVDSAVRVRLTLTASDRLPARESTALAIEVTDADKAAADAQAVAMAAGGRILSADVNRSPTGPATAKVAIDVPLARAADVIRDLRQLGTVRGVDAGRDATAPAGPLAHAHVELTLATADAIVADTSGPWANVRHGLSVGLTGLLWSLQLIVVGLCLLVPWAAVGWALRAAWRRWRASAKAAV